MNESTLTYGEIEFHPFAEVFDTIRARYGGIPSGGVFYDLGSGTGKAVVAAALLHDFTISRGIEIVESLYDVSLQLKQAYDETTSKLQGDNAQSSIVPLEFFMDSFFSRDFTDATFIFANSTCFSDSMMEQIAQRPVMPGTFGISFTRSFPGGSWEILESIRKNMSWGEATVYIQRKKAPEAEGEAEQAEI